MRTALIRRTKNIAHRETNFSSKKFGTNLATWAARRWEILPLPTSRKSLEYFEFRLKKLQTAVTTFFAMIFPTSGSFTAYWVPFSSGSNFLLSSSIQFLATTYILWYSLLLRGQILSTRKFDDWMIHTTHCSYQYSNWWYTFFFKI